MRHIARLLFALAFLSCAAPLFAQGAGPTAPPQRANAEYFYADFGSSERLGPVSFDAIRELVGTGAVRADSWVWTAGMENWARADSLPELSSLFKPAVEPEPEVTSVAAETINLPQLSASLSEQERHRVAAVMGATLGILFHEFGHALIGELGIPATGPEEDAADEFSALLLGTALAPADLADEPLEVQSMMVAITQFSTLLWHFDARAGAIAGFEKPWYDEHSDSENRFRNTFCLIYGADPATQAALADEAQFPQLSRDRCTFDYPRRYKAWQAITAPFIRDPGDGTGEPGNQPPETPGGRLTVVFDPSTTGTGQYLLPVFRGWGLFEEVGAIMQQAFVWPRDLRIEFADCGEANAFYDPQNARIRMCWEGVEYFAGVVLDGRKLPRR